MEDLHGRDSARRERSGDALVDAYGTIVDFIKSLGYNTPDDLANLRDTPERCQRALEEVVWPISRIRRSIEHSLEATFPARSSEMVVAENIIAFSLCPHHLLPVIYRVTLAYLPKPGEEVIGISKIPRIVQALSKRPVLHEVLCQDLAEVFFRMPQGVCRGCGLPLPKDIAEGQQCPSCTWPVETTEPQWPGMVTYGSAVHISGLHMCMASRGVKAWEARLTCKGVRGAFRRNADTREEFTALVGSTRVALL